MSKNTGEVTNTTLDEQREWVAEQLDLIIGASGETEGWFDIYWQDVFWAEDRTADRELLLSALRPRDCGGSGGRINLSLKNTTPVAPFGAAAKVRAMWEAEGWEVSNIRSYESDPYFRADRDDGAFMSFDASEKGMSLSVHTACSVNNTVTNWQSYRGDSNEFKDELERRGEQSGE